MARILKVLTVGWLLVPLAGLAGCGRSTPLEPGTVLSIRIIPHDPALYRNQMVQLRVEGLFAEKNSEEWVEEVRDITREPKLSFRLDDRGVIDLLTGARLLARQPGQARLIASYLGREGSIAVTVKPAELTGIQISPSVLHLEVGDYIQLKVSGTLSDGSQLDLTPGAMGTTYAADDQLVASVTVDGLVFAVGEGQTVVQVEHQAFSEQASVSVGPGANLVSLELKPDQLDLKVGGAFQLQLIGHYQDNSTSILTNHPDTGFASSDDRVASVTGSGWVTAHWTGEATITATHRSFSAQSRIRVSSGPELIGIEVDPPAVVLPLGGWVQLAVWANYSDGTGLDVTTEASYQSSNPQAIEVNPSGLVLGKSPGTGVVKATYGGFEASIAVQVENRALVAIDLTPNSAELWVGETMNCQVIGTYDDGSQEDLTAAGSGTSYSSMNPSVATVSPDGVVRGVSAGEAFILAVNSGLSDDAWLTVHGLQLVSVSVEPKSLNLQEIGESAQLTVWAGYTDGSVQNVTTQAAYSSSNPMVASVQGNGLVVAVGDGSATITVSFGGLLDKCQVTVVDIHPVPVLQSIDPDQVVAGSGSITLSANGSKFDGSSMIALDSQNLATTWVSSNRLTARVPASTTAVVGAHQVAVVNPPPGGGTSGSLPFLVVGAPSVASLSPDSGLQGTEVRVVFDGGGLLGCNLLPGNPGITASGLVHADDGTRLFATFSIASWATPGGGSVTLSNLAGSTAVTFTVIEYSPLPNLEIKPGEVVYLQGVQAYQDITIGTGAVVFGIGDEPLQLLSTGNVTVRGEIHVSGSPGDDGYYNPADGGSAGPAGGGGGGGGDGDSPVPSQGGVGSPPGQGGGTAQGAGTPSGNGGGTGSGGGISGGCGQAGGGGGFGGDGGSGGGDSGVGTGGAGGRANTGGSNYNGGVGGGGGSTCGANCGGGGGGGGGVLVIASVTGGQVVIDGALFADGGNGGDGFYGTGGGGGGSGGRITITAANGSIVINDTLSVRGGAGGRSDAGDGGGGGGGGRILVDAGAGSVDDRWGYYDVRGGVGGQSRDTGYSGQAGSPGVSDIQP